MSNADDCKRHVGAALAAIEAGDDASANRHWREAERFFRDVTAVRVSTAWPAATPAQAEEAERAGWPEAISINRAHQP